MAASLAGSAAYGQATSTPQVRWNTTTGKYNWATNWDPNVVPTNTALQFLEISNGGTATVDGTPEPDGTSHFEGAFLHLGLRPNESGNLVISNGSMTLGEFHVGGRATIPNNFADWTAGTTPNGGGTGSVVHTGGTLNVTYSLGTDIEPPIQSMYVGNGGLTGDAETNTANGSYTISNNAVLNVGINTGDHLAIGTGKGTVGTFTQLDTSTVNSTGRLTVARRGATANYNMQGGTLSVGRELIIGDGEANPTLTTTAGTFTQTGGQTTVGTASAGFMQVGAFGGTGTYSITGATSSLNARSIEVGRGAKGTFIQGTTGAADGPTVTLNTGALNVGFAHADAPVSDALYHLKSGTLTVNGSGTNGTFVIGNEVNGKGTFIQDGGTITVSDIVQLGRNNSNQDNRYIMNGGALTTKRVFVGGGTGAANGRGSFTLNGGTFTATGDTMIGVGGNTTTASGTMTITGGTYNASGTSGTSLFYVGAGGPGRGGALVLSGGTLSAEAANATIDVGRDNSNGSFTISGTGVLKATQLRGGGSATGTRVFNFDGGTSTIGTVSFGAATWNFNGGTHTVTGSTALGTGSTLNANMDFSLPAVTHGNSTVNVAAGKTLTFGTSTSSDIRTMTKGGEGTLTITGTQSHVAGAGVVVNAGTVNENSNPAGKNVTVNGGTVNFNSGVANVGTLTATAGVAKQAAGKTNVLVANTVAATGGKIDLTDGKLITTTPVGTATTVVGNTRTYDGLQGMVQSAKAGDTWTGNGLTSSVAATEGGLTTIGIANGAQAKGGIGATETALWGGQTVTGSSILAMYTYAGDANLDGAITGDDYSAIDFGILFEGMDGYANGDFNYDGYVTGDDYSVIDLNILLQGPQIPTGGSVAFGAESSAGLAGVTAVPEPASLSLLALGAASLLRRRRRTN